MPIDWDTETERAKQAERARHEQAEELRRQRRDAYLADTERITRDQPEAIEIALRLMRQRPDCEEQVKAAAEVADLEKLKQWASDVRFPGSVFV